MPDRVQRRVLVAGGTSFVGYRVIRALLDEGADVTVLVRPDGEDKLGIFKNRVRQVQGDPWNPSSLRGRARGHHTVINLIGGIKQDPARGLTFRHLNFVSARNMAQMAVNDGVPHFILLSAVTAPLGVPTDYIDSKREAERYIQKSGLFWSIVRAPVLFARSELRNPLYWAVRIAYRIPLLGLPLAPYAPMLVDIAAWGIANLALTAEESQNRLVGPRQLRRLGRVLQRRFVTATEPIPLDTGDQDLDEPPFGWLPPG